MARFVAGQSVVVTKIVDDANYLKKYVGKVGKITAELEMDKERPEPRYVVEIPPASIGYLGKVFYQSELSEVAA